MIYKSIATLQPVHDTNQRAYDIVHIAGYISRNLPSLSANSTMLGRFSTRELVYQCGCHKHLREALTLFGCIGLHLHR